MEKDLLEQSIKFARKKSIFYNTHFSYVRKNDLSENSFRMLCGNIGEVTERKQIGDFIRLYNCKSEDREKDFWKEVISFEGRGFMALDGLNPAVDFITRSVYGVDPRTMYYDYEKINEYDYMICDEKHLWDIISKHPEVKTDKVIVLQDRDTVLPDVTAQRWNAQVIRVKYIMEVGLPLGYGEKEYRIRKDYHACCLNPSTMEKVPDGEYGLLTVTTLQDDCQPLINYVTDHFTRINRESGLLERDDDSDPVIRLLNVVYSSKGIKDFSVKEGKLRISADESFDEFELVYQLKKNRVEVRLDEVKRA